MLVNSMKRLLYSLFIVMVIVACSESGIDNDTEKGLIVLAQSEYEFGVEGGNLDLEILTNVDVTVTISDNATDWIEQVTTRALETKALYFNIAASSTEEDREGTITIWGGNATQTITVMQSGLNEIFEQEREALISFYKATGGDNWTRNDNWCSDKPVSEWYGISMNGDFVTSIALNSNNLVGEIDEVLSNVTKLQSLELVNNNLTLINLSDCKSLEYLSCYDNKLISLNVANCSKLFNLLCYQNMLSTINLEGCSELAYCIIDSNELKELNIDSCENLINLSCMGNKLTTLNVVDKPNLLDLSCQGNALTSLNIENCEKLQRCFCNFNQINNLNIENCHNIEELWCHRNNLSILNVSNMPNLISLLYGNGYEHQEGYGHNNITSIDISQNTELEEFSCFGMDVTSLNVNNNTKLKSLECSENPIKSLDVSALIELKELWCHSMDLSEDLDVSNNTKLEYLSCEYNPNLTKVYISLEQDFSYTKDGTTKFCIKGSDILYDEFPYYTSTDYSKDGAVTILQKASIENGLNIVLMGDAYTDRLIDDGTYEKTMRVAMNHFFSIEPYNSFKKYFNVYLVNAVSKNEFCGYNASTALSCQIGYGGNDGQVFSYAQKAVADDKIDDTAIIVIVNEPLSEYTYDGLCKLYTPSTGNNDYGKGASIAYICRGSNEETFESLIHHEANGHGFAKLGDEYAQYSDIPNNVINEIETLSQYGWLKNIDLTNDPTTIKWNRLLNDNRYETGWWDGDNEFGIFEGAYNYQYGVYRPTRNGVMNSCLYMNFNAPSREAIYYRIHKLAYGADWNYDYEAFVEWDAMNRATSASTRGIPYSLDIHENFKHTHSPVVVKSSWHEAKNNVPAKSKNRSALGNAGSNLREVSTSKAQMTTKPMTIYSTETLREGNVVTITVDESGMIKHTVTK